MDICETEFLKNWSNKCTGNSFISRQWYCKLSQVDSLNEWGSQIWRYSWSCRRCLVWLLIGVFVPLSNPCMSSYVAFFFATPPCPLPLLSITAAAAAATEAQYTCNTMIRPSASVPPSLAPSACHRRRCRLTLSVCNHSWIIKFGRISYLLSHCYPLLRFCFAALRFSAFWPSIYEWCLKSPCRQTHILSHFSGFTRLF